MSYTNLRSAFDSFFNQEEGKRYVRQVLDGKKYIRINLDEIDSDVAHDFINKAVKFGIREITEALDDAVRVMNGSMDNVEVGFVGECIPLVKGHEIGSEHIGKLIRVKGIVNQTHFIKPMAIEVVFKCRECGAITQGIIQESPFILSSPPRKCEGCDERVSYDIVEEMSTYIDSQEFTLQESYEDISGRVPQRIKMITFKKHLINKVYCGDSVEIFGIVKVIPTYRERKKSRLNITYIDIYALKKYSRDPETMEIGLEEEQEIISLSKEPDIYERLIENLAPSIYGWKKCKEGCLLAMVGGMTKHKKDITIRGNIHVLMVGDASTGKSQLLKTVAELSPRGLYASGKGVSGVGLTAALTKDQDGEWVINAGVLVLANNGVASIDEIDKMNPDDRVNIHEAMAQQTVTISKAGLHSTLMARTAVIGAANPAFGKYDKTKSVFENLSKFPPTLFSRFDLIFILIDEPKKDMEDEKVLERIESEEPQIEMINRDLFKKYIAYAKGVKTKLSVEAKEELKKFFLGVRKQTRKNGDADRIPITFRQYEALIRLCEAHARILLKKEADLEDAKAAIRIFGEFLEDINFDFEGMETGKPKSQLDIEKLIYGIVKQHQEIYGISHNDVINKAKLTIKDEKKIVKTVANLLNAGQIMIQSYDDRGNPCYRTAT